MKTKPDVLSELLTGFQALVAHTSSCDFCNKLDLPGLFIGLIILQRLSF